VVTRVIVDEPGQERLYRMCRATSVMAPPLIRRWRRRSGIASGVRTRKPLVATAACPVHSAGASYGPLGWRLRACCSVFDPTRVVGTGPMTLEAMVLSLKQYWRFIDANAFE
jgi:hypothetical protein